MEATFAQRGNRLEWEERSISRASEVRARQQCLLVGSRMSGQPSRCGGELPCGERARRWSQRAIRPRALSDWVESESALDSLFDRIFCGKPASTFPENALAVTLPPDVHPHCRGWRWNRGIPGAP